MKDSTGESAPKAGLPFILLAAVAQGWSLYGLHHSLRDHHWPATDHAWLYALYAVAVFIPAALELLADFARKRALWLLLALLGVAFFYCGWHHGTNVDFERFERLNGAPDSLTLAFEFGVLWLLVLPFLQTRLALGVWSTAYAPLFANAWRNKLVLAEAALFTGLFWLLLFLWQTLFHMLKIDYFRELFEEPIFIYPVTSLTFGCAVHLVGSVERFTSVVLEQILSVLKWLATIAGAILAFFTVALIFNLPDLVFTGQKAIGAAWLLWLLAVMVLLLNAAYRDGSIGQPYPKWVAQPLRWCVPFMIVVAITALYALQVRTRHYGLTVERFWALLIAGMALLYSVGYSIAAFGARAWLGGIARVNVVAALILIAVLAASLTPVASPYRLSANSQFELIRREGLAHEEGDNNYRWQSSPLSYLRFDAGRYGRSRLEQLSRLGSGPEAESIRRAATAMLARTNRWDANITGDAGSKLAKLRIFPGGRALDKVLIDALVEDSAKAGTTFLFQKSTDNSVGVFIDLDGDHADEFVLITNNSGVLYAQRGGHWIRIGSLFDAASAGIIANFARSVLHELEQGNFSAVRPEWSELKIGTQVYRVSPQQL
jgi:Domain of unknown function (DUF4153)